MTAELISSKFDIPRPTISKHLNVIYFNRNSREGQCTILNAKKMGMIAEFLEPFRPLWDERFNKLEEIMKFYKKDQS